MRERRLVLPRRPQPRLARVARGHAPLPPERRDHRPQRGLPPPPGVGAPEPPRHLDQPLAFQHHRPVRTPRRAPHLTPSTMRHTAPTTRRGPWVRSVLMTSEHPNAWAAEAIRRLHAEGRAHGPTPLPSAPAARAAGRRGLSQGRVRAPHRQRETPPGTGHVLPGDRRAAVSRRTPPSGRRHRRRGRRRGGPLRTAARPSVPRRRTGEDPGGHPGPHRAGGRSVAGGRTAAGHGAGRRPASWPRGSATLPGPLHRRRTGPGRMRRADDRRRDLRAAARGAAPGARVDRDGRGGATSASIGRQCRHHGHPTRLAVVDPENSAYFPHGRAAAATYATRRALRIPGIGRPRTEPGFSCRPDRPGDPGPGRRVRRGPAVASRHGRRPGRPGGRHRPVGRVPSRVADARGGRAGSVVSLVGDHAEPYRDTHLDPEWGTRAGARPRAVRRGRRAGSPPRGNGTPVRPQRRGPWPLPRPASVAEDPQPAATWPTSARATSAMASRTSGSVTVPVSASTAARGTGTRTHASSTRRAPVYPRTCAQG